MAGRVADNRETGLAPGARMTADEAGDAIAAGHGRTAFDPEAARRHMGVDADDFRRVFDCIWNEVSSRRTLLDAACAANDLKSVVLHAHTIKSSAAAIGAEALSLAAAAVEQAARQHSEDALASAMRRLHAARETLSRLTGIC